MGVFQVSYLSMDTAPWTLQVGALEKPEDFPFVSAYLPDSLRSFAGHGGRTTGSWYLLNMLAVYVLP